MFSVDIYICSTSCQKEEKVVNNPEKQEDDLEKV